MNLITNILIITYINYSFDLSNFSLYLLIFGVIYPYFEYFITIFFKNKLLVNNKLFHSVIILSIINMIVSFLILKYYKENFFEIFAITTLGSFIHLFCDLLKTKTLYLLYPFKKQFYIGVIDYFDYYINTTLLLSIFLVILDIINLYFIPFLVILFYVSIKWLIKQYLQKKFDEIKQYEHIIVLPTFFLKVWEIIVIKENTLIFIQQELFNKEYSSVRTFHNNLSKETNDILEEKSKIYKYFKNEFKYFYQFETKKGNSTIVNVFDLISFFHLFKKEQYFYTAILKDNKIKERINI